MHERDPGFGGGLGRALRTRRRGLVATPGVTAQTANRADTSCLLEACPLVANTFGAVR